MSQVVPVLRYTASDHEPGAGLVGLLSLMVQETVNDSPDFTVAGAGSVMPVTTSSLGGGASMISGGFRKRLLLFSLPVPPSKTAPMAVAAGGSVTTIR